jgi:hypothetical protein
MTLYPDSSRQITIPVRATSITLCWPGVGVVRNLTVPPFTPSTDQVTVQIPAWEPGAIFSGVILGSDGNPYAGKVLSLRSSLGDSGEQATVKTDDKGAFSIKGLLPGWMSLRSDIDQNANWLVSLPAEGLTDVTLSIAAKPNRISLSGGINASLCWWLPDGGAPQRLACQYNWVNVDGLQGAGWMWAIDASGRGQYARLDIDHLPNDRYISGPTSTGSSLGLYFPLEPGKGMPHAVTLIGLDNRAGIEATFTQLPWQPSAMLNTTVTQISTVPPGKYRVIVDTDQGHAEAEVTVGDYGGRVRLDYPTEP